MTTDDRIDLLEKQSAIHDEMIAFCLNCIKDYFKQDLIDNPVGDDPKV